MRIVVEFDLVGHEPFGACVDLHPDQLSNASWFEFEWPYVISSITDMLREGVR